MKQTYQESAIWLPVAIPESICLCRYLRVVGRVVVKKYPHEPLPDTEQDEKDRLSTNCVNGCSRSLIGTELSTPSLIGRYV